MHRLKYLKTVTLAYLIFYSKMCSYYDFGFLFTYVYEQLGVISYFLQFKASKYIFWGGVGCVWGGGGGR